MDINNLKNMVDEQEKQVPLIKEMRVKAIEEFEKFKVVCNKIIKLTDDKINHKKQSFINEFVEYFKSNGFETEHIENKYIAKYKTIKVVLKNTECEILLFEMLPQKIYLSIEVKPSMDVEEKKSIRWKNILNFGDKDINSDNYKEILSSIEDMKTLENLIMKIEDNIKHYQNTIDKSEDIEYVYSLYDTHIECESFKELFEQHINDEND
ncbi:hypothetical protein [Anaerophilus nitritogenes]|uniref:hypothetical protein n=1 Tax=Anaerophilus nitritogenes TaxID=2498136 RepID=UPI00101CAF8E|nr:hypothetical protein [Anaerophilus nitritogenes]